MTLDLLCQLRVRSSEVTETYLANTYAQLEFFGLLSSRGRSLSTAASGPVLTSSWMGFPYKVSMMTVHSPTLILLGKILAEGVLLPQYLIQASSREGSGRSWISHPSLCESL